MDTLTPRTGDGATSAAVPLRVQKAPQKMRYRALLEAAPDAIIVVDQLGTIVLVNAQAQKLFGYARNELIGKPAEVLISESFRSGHRDRYSSFLAPPAERPAVLGTELFALRKDGSEFPVEIRLSPIDTAKGTLVSSAIRDITDRRRTEEDLRRLASIVAYSDDAIIGETLEGIITTWNASAERMYGYTAAEAMGKSASMLVPADRLDEITKIRERLKSGQIVDHFESLRVRKDGGEFPVEITVSPIRDQMEIVVGTSAIGRDISERKRREEDQSRLAAVVESSHDAIIGRTLDGIITHWNKGAQRIYGYSSAEIIGKPKSMLFSPHERAQSLETLGRVKHGETVEEPDATRVRRDGTEVHFSLIHAPIRNVDGEVIGVSTVGRDVTESRQLEGMFRQAQRMDAVGQLAGGIAHDFNNLLAVILGYTELLLDNLSADDSKRRDVDEIQRAAERAALLTRQLLAFSRKQVLQPRVLDVNAVVAGAENLLQRLIGENIELRVILKPALGRVKADAGQLEQIVMNLAVNSRDAMPAGGKLTIETSNVTLDEPYTSEHACTSQGPHVMLAVTDTGCGMDEETKRHIFDPFFTTKGPGKGTGLGLATVYGIVKQSGGSVRVNTEPGVGTTFNVYFPCVDAAVEVPLLIGDAEADRGSKTILIVEDDAALLQVTHRALRELGYSTLPASNPAQALQISERHSGPIHLMVTDVILPGMSGGQLASHLSLIRPEMKVLYISGYTDDTIVHHGVLNAGLAFLQKPFSPKTLARKVTEVLAARLPVGIPENAGR